MNKILWCVLFSLISILFFSAKGEVCYATDDTLDLQVKYITASEAITLNNNSYVKRGTTLIAEGDYAITLYITNNTGFASTGFHIYYNANLITPLTYDNGDKLVRHYGIAGDDISFSTYCYSNTLGMGSISGTNEEDDGEIVTFFVRPQQGFDIDEDENDIIIDFLVLMWSDNHAQPINVNVLDTITIYHCEGSALLGDINNDGDIASDDTMILNNIYNNYAPIDMENYNMIYWFGSTPILGGYLIATGDVNGDGIIDNDDADMILMYYMNYVLINASGYTGPIGTTVYYFTITTVQL